MICPIQLMICVMCRIFVLGVIAFSKADTISSSFSIGKLKIQLRVHDPFALRTLAPGMYHIGIILFGADHFIPGFQVKAKITVFNASVALRLTAISSGEQPASRASFCRSGSRPWSRIRHI
jgi:hypothetical protein